MRIILRSERAEGQAGSGPPKVDALAPNELLYESAGGAAAESAVCLIASIADAVIDMTADACELAADTAEAEARCRSAGAVAEANAIQRQAAIARLALGGRDSTHRTEIWLVPDAPPHTPVKLGTLLGADVRGLLRDPLARIAAHLVRHATPAGLAILADLARPKDAPGEAADTRWSVLGVPEPEPVPKPKGRKAAAAPPEPEIDLADDHDPDFDLI